MLLAQQLLDVQGAYAVVKYPWVTLVSMRDELAQLLPSQLETPAVNPHKLSVSVAVPRRNCCD